MRVPLSKSLLVGSIATLIVSSLPVQVSAATNTFLNTGATWIAGANWSSTNVPQPTDALLIDGGSAAAETLDASYSVQTLSFNTGATAITIDANTSGNTTAQSLALTGGTDALGGTGNLINLSNTTTGPVNIGTTAGVGTTTLTFNTTGAINVGNASATLTLGANSILAGTSGFSKTGAGTLVLGGNNTGFLGGVALSGGTLKISSANNLPSGNALTFTNGATLSTTAAITLANNVTIASGQAGTIKQSATTGTTTLSGDYSQMAGTLTLDASGSSSFGGFFANGTGTAAGSTVNFLGATGSASAQLQMNSTVSQTFFANAKLSVTATGSGTTFIAGGNSASNLNLQFGALDGGNASTQIGFDNRSGCSVTINGTVDGTYSGRIFNGAGSAGAVNMVKTGAATQVFTGANAYTGSTTIKNGTLQLAGTNNRLSASTAVTIGDASTSGKLVLGSTGLSGVTDGKSDLTIAGLSTTGNGGSVVSGNATASTLTVSPTSGTNIFNGTLGGAGTNENQLALTKAGAGTLNLGGTNTYSGATTVNAGKLLVSAGGLTGTSGFTINGGSLELGANNLLRDAASVTLAGGAFATGGFSDTVGTLSLTLNSTIDFGAGTSVLNFAATATPWTATRLLTINNWSGDAAGSGTDRLFFGSDATGLLAGNVSAIQFVNPTNYAPGTYSAQILSTGEIVAVVPEPGAWMSLIGGMGLLTGLRRRRAAL